jgi:caa(3)-type oxidase subunit IV
MDAHTPEAIAQEERRYLRIFLVLGVLTVLEVAVTRVSALPHGLVAASLVLMAALKAALVALYYMHLATEKTLLMWIALTPAILCVFLLLMLTPDLGALTRMITHAMAGAPAAAH